ncbi:MAG: hypothetical protein KDC80_21535 [Saprospiraceae bacterium]|nr:hypothetical protein [Saprospiraceae bacterium]
MDISRFLKKSNSLSELIPDEYRISEQEWQQEVRKNSRLVYFHDFANSERTAKYDNVAILITSGSEKLARLDLIQGSLHVYYDKIQADLIVELSKIAYSLNAKLLINPQQEYPRQKILAAQKRLTKKSKKPEVEYQKESFGGNNMWLVIRSNITYVKKYFCLQGEEKPWSEALKKMHACAGMFMFEFCGWTFIAGQKTDILFDCQVKGEKAIVKCHVDKLLEWGKAFNDVQLFMHYDRSMYFNAFYRVLNGEMVYGEYESESYQKKYGKIPENVKDLPDGNANTVALEWSYDPDFLRYQKELEDAKAWVVNVKEEA